jgi:hypothetical protein
MFEIILNQNTLSCDLYLAGLEFNKLIKELIKFYKIEKLMNLCGLKLKGKYKSMGRP